MELTKRDVGFWGRMTGLAVAVLLACTACCIPLIAPLLAWFGVATLTLSGPVGVLIAALLTTAIVFLAVWRRRRSLNCQSARRAASTCQGACAVDTNPVPDGGGNNATR
jgi:membrane protein implicated in regulation of membrane protease activity